MNASIDKLTQYFDSAIEKPVEKEALKNGIKGDVVQAKLLRVLLSMAQEGHDLSCVSADILRIIDSLDARQKSFACLFLRWCKRDDNKRDDIKQKLFENAFTSTFVAELNSKNVSIQKKALTDLVALSDVSALKNYIYDVKKICVQENPEAHASLALAIGQLYLKEKELFAEHGFARILKSLLKSDDKVVLQNALRSLLVIERHECLVEDNILAELLAAHHLTEDFSLLRILLTIIKYRPFSDVFTDHLENLVYSTDLSLFYLSSKILLNNLRIEPIRIMEHALGFINTRNEQLYSLLIYIDRLISLGIGADSSYFLIHSDDPEYIKMRKIAILFKIKDDLAIQEIKREYRRCVGTRALIFKLSLENGILTEIAKDMDTDSLATLSAIYYTKDISDEWKVAIEGHFNGIKQPNHLNEIIEVSLKCCKGIPTFINEADRMENAVTLLRFYSLMFIDQKINKEECLEKLEELSRENPKNRRISIIIRHIDNISADIFTPPRKLSFCKRSSEEELSVDFHNTASGDSLLSVDNESIDELLKSELDTILNKRTYNLKNFPLCIDSE
ncbi:hypothetical protein ENBRE01_1799 [Enteropsectra breve]|nr:hypothetical protein ENBRE01_1799 [Enteropsectra breve]